MKWLALIGICFVAVTLYRISAAIQKSIFDEDE